MDTSIHYRCGTCEKYFTGDQFYWRKRGPQAGQRMNTCKRCNVIKVDNWNKANSGARKRTVFKYDEAHRAQSRAYHKKYRDQKTIEERRAPWLMRAYKMTNAQYSELLKQQGGTCALCPAISGRPSGGHLSVDHDHQTRQVRGLLCVLCNTALGLLGDDPERLTRAADYLRSHALSRVLAGA